MWTNKLIFESILNFDQIDYAYISRKYNILSITSIYLRTLNDVPFKGNVNNYY